MNLHSLSIVIKVILIGLLCPICSVLTAVAANSYQTLPQPLAQYTAISINLNVDDVELSLRRIDFWDGFIVFVGTARATDSSGCVFRDDFSLQVGSIQYEASSRDTTRRNYGIDSPGTGFFGQCFSNKEVSIVLLPFAVPVTQAKAEIRFKNQRRELPNSLEVLRQNSRSPMATATPTPTLTPTPSSTPTSTYTPAMALAPSHTVSTFSLPSPSSAYSVFRNGDVSNNGIKFALERIDFWNAFPDNKSSKNGMFVVFTGTLSRINDGYSTHCVGAGDITLRVGNKVYEMDDMRSAQMFYRVDFPGYIVPQCADANRPVPTFFVFDVNLTTHLTSISFHHAPLQLDLALAELVPQDVLVANLNDSAEASANATSIFTPNQIPTVSPTPFSAMQVVVNQNANLRKGPGTNFEVVGSAKAGQEVVVIGKNTDSDWYLLDNQVWIAAFLVDGRPDIPIVQYNNNDQSLLQTPTPGDSPKFVPIGIFGVFSGVKVYYGRGANKAYGFEILGGSGDCTIMPSGKGVKVRYPSGSEEWKDRDHIVLSDLYFYLDNDPAAKALLWYEYFDCP